MRETATPSFLSERRAEAKSVKSKQEPDEDGERRVIPAHIQVLAPRLELLRKLLREFADQLNVVEPEVDVGISILNYGALKDLRQRDYRMIASEARPVTGVSFQFVCQGKQPLRFYTTTRDECHHVQSYLDGHKLRYHWKDTDHWRYLFTVEPWVPVSFDFEAHPARPEIRLTVRNFNGLGVTTNAFQPERVDAELVDELVKYAVRRENRFDEITGNRVPPEVRQAFKEKIEERRRQREAEVRSGQWPLGSLAVKKPSLKDLFQRRTPGRPR